MTTESNRHYCFRLRCITGILWFQLIACWCRLGHADILSDDLPGQTETLTNIAQIEALQSKAQNETSDYSIRLEGTILLIDTNHDEFILQDDSGGMVIKSSSNNAPPLVAGQRVVIKGKCLISQGSLILGPLINDDGIHSATEKTRSILLRAGLHPILVQWFNGPTDYALQIDWAGPEMARQSIPSTSLYRTNDSGNIVSGKFLPGLNFSSYEGAWTQLPDFTSLPAIKRSVVTNFDLSVRPRNTNVALVFSGYLSVPHTGVYQFWLRSDDGGKLFLGDEQLQIQVVGSGTWPQPRKIFADGSNARQSKYEWSEVEGIVTRVNEIHGGVLVELTAGAGRAYLQVPDGNYGTFSPLLRSRIRALGISQNASTVDGQFVPSLIVPNLNDLTITEMAPTHWMDSPVQTIQSLVKTNVDLGTVVHVVGIFQPGQNQAEPLIEDHSGKITLDLSQPQPLPGTKIEAIGWRDVSHGQPLLRGAFYRPFPSTIPDGTNTLPLLTKAIQVKSLDRTEAQRGYPVKIQGVITARVASDFVIQDSTWSIFSYWRVGSADRLPEIGDYWEIEGQSDIDFAPNVLVNHATYLGPGVLPEPIHPTQEELINGSLDTQYIELQGIVTDDNTDGVTLLTSDGKINVQFYMESPPASNHIEDALVRLRGVCSPNRDTNHMILGNLAPLRLFNASINIDEPAPAHPFEIPLKHISDLLYFDARADALRRVRVAGQILGEHQGEYFLSDHDNGLRFDPKTTVDLPPGTLVEVVGFPDMTGPSPVLREALVRPTGRANLPTPKELTTSNLPDSKLDATLVTVKARLAGMSYDRSERVLELQTGTHDYMARLANNHGVLPDIESGSLLGLTGVYISAGGYRNSDRNLGSFELLLNSPADVVVLAKPSWWNFRHTLTVMLSLSLIILAALVWITLLRRQVDERTRQWASEMKGREVAERQRALEAERARIAQDLHDDLGATLTEIRFLGAVKSRDAQMPEGTRTQLKEISEKSRQLVSSLDEIVWAVNPANDSLPSLATYLRHVAEEFFRTTQIRYRLDVDQPLPTVALTSEVRHNLYLAVREALNNIAKHSQATESWLRIHWKDQSLLIIVEDNGCGFVEAEVTRSRNGLANMRRRLEKIGGTFSLETHLGSGTVCRIYLPLK